MVHTPNRLGVIDVEEVPPPQRTYRELTAQQRHHKNAHQREYMRVYNKINGREQKQKYRLLKPFVGVDGEGSQQEYLLLRAGDQLLHTGRPLTFVECMSFLCDLPRDAEYVAFFFDYDVTMMLRNLPAERIQRLLKPKKGKRGQALPINVGPFELAYRPGKEFKVRRGRDDKWLVINDVGSFFQCSFLKALEAWGIGSTEQIEKVTAGKADRSNFTVMSDVEIEYNWIECALLAQLMAKFAAACRGIGFLPRHWQGPGELAAAMMSYHGVPRRKDLDGLLPEGLLEAGNKAFYGGRSEIGVVGIVKGPLKLYDINSAYPDALTTVPCLIHGEWELTEHVPSSDMYLAYGSYTPTKDVQFYGFPHRDDNGGVHFPANGLGWYWSVEIDQAIHQEFKPSIIWNYHRKCRCQPFDFVPALYRQRKEWQKNSDNPLAGNMGIALKLALNSLYGKTCQSIGAAPYANPLYASYITAYTRAKLYSMVHAVGCKTGTPNCGHNVYYLATDGLIAAANVKPKGVTLSDELGDFGVEDISDDILFVQPGLYLGSQQRLKNRGIPRDLMQPENWNKAWTNFHKSMMPKALGGKQLHPHDKTISVEVMLHQFMGLKQAHHFNRMEDAGKWSDIPRTYTFRWETKRGRRFMPMGSFIVLTPIEGSTDKETLPYSKEIGLWMQQRLPKYLQEIWFEFQPDDATFSLERNGTSLL